MAGMITSIIMVALLNLVAYGACLTADFSRGIPVTNWDKIALTIAPLAEVIIEPQHIAMRNWPFNVDATWWIPALVIVVLEATLIYLSARGVAAVFLKKHIEN
jgi:hypothetical protein